MNRRINRKLKENEITRNAELERLNCRKNRGITLIALVITIVILIILATVAINFIFGENGLIDRASQAREMYTEGDEQETIALAIAAIKAKLEPIERDNLQEEIEALRGEDSVEVTEIGENMLQVRFNASGNTYMVNKDGDMVDTEVKLNATYEVDPETNEIYLTPTIENLDSILEAMSQEEWINSLVTAMSQEQKEKMFLDYINMVSENFPESNLNGPYNTIEELLAGEGYSSIEEMIQNETMFQEMGVSNLDEFSYSFGYEGMVIIENPDGSLNLATIGAVTYMGYPVEGGQAYTFKIRFMGIEIEKKIEIADLSDWEWEVNDDGQTVTITSYKGDDTVVTFPSEIYGMKVTAIGSGEWTGGGIYNAETVWNESICETDQVTQGSYYFKIQNTIEKIIIPDGIEKINNWAFAGTVNLKEVELPNTLKTISQTAFYNCTKLNNINIPNEVTSIGQLAFANCSSLSNIYIPSKVTDMGRNAFYDCTNLTTINIEATSIPTTWDPEWKGDCTATVNTGVAMN